MSAASELDIGSVERSGRSPIAKLAWLGLLGLGIVSARPAFAASCGDGVLDSGEDCDDYNTTDGDGCSSSCAVESGWECSVTDLGLSAAEELVDTSSYGSASWTVATDGLSAVQSANSDPTVYVTTLDPSYGTLVVTLTVSDTGDNDYIGIALGFDVGESTDSSADYLLLSWKKETQTKTSPAWGTAYVGLKLSEVTGVPDEYDLWSLTGSVDNFASADTLGSTGWVAGTEYTFEIDYDSSSLVVSVNGTGQFAETGTFPDGPLGFYVFSQPDLAVTIEQPQQYTACASTDADGDGYDASEDCDDSDATVYPGATEVCDSVDNDCDGLVDDDDDDLDTSTARAYYIDGDGDGYGLKGTGAYFCEKPAGRSRNYKDCDDTDASIHPGATEIPDDGIDQDCDGEDGTPSGDGGSGDGGSPDGGSPDGGSPDGGSPDGGSPDGGSPDGGSPDGGSPDGGSPDGGSPDGGSPDGGFPDGGSADGGDVGEYRGGACGCASGGADRGAGGLAAVLFGLVGGALVRRRRG